MLSRLQFESAAQAFACRHPCWNWVDGHRPGYGYLTRSTNHFLISSTDGADSDWTLLQTDEVEDDPAAAVAQALNDTLTVDEYIVFSASFSVPAFYFTVHDTTGSPSSLTDILQSSFFKTKPPQNAQATGFALTLPSSSFPLLSQGEHPTLGIACWYFHPCESANAVGEFMAEEDGAEWTEVERNIRWLELWLMVVGSVLRVD